jgi:hypothetical protein
VIRLSELKRGIRDWFVTATDPGAIHALITDLRDLFGQLITVLASCTSLLLWLLIALLPFVTVPLCIYFLRQATKRTNEAFKDINQGGQS